MPNVLPTIPNDPPQGIQALLDKVYLWNPSVSNELIAKINALLSTLGDAAGAIKPYAELIAPLAKYVPCYYGDGVYVAKTDLSEIPAEFNEEDWELIANKGGSGDVASVNGQTGEVVLTAEDINVNFAEEETTLQVAVDTLKEDQGQIGDQLQGIEEKIPEAASTENQLATKQDLNGYLPVTGGTGDGFYKFRRLLSSKYEVAYSMRLEPYLADGTELTPFQIRLGNGYVYLGDSNYITLSYTSKYLRPDENNAWDLGSDGYSWANVYTAKINNGADLLVPTEGGTLARLEDIEESVTTKDLTVGTEEGTLNIGVTAGVATIATNNGLDIVSQTKFDTAPTTDDTTAWANVNPTALVTKQQVVTALGDADGGSSEIEWDIEHKYKMPEDGSYVGWLRPEVDFGVLPDGEYKFYISASRSTGNYYNDEGVGANGVAWLTSVVYFNVSGGVAVSGQSGIVGELYGLSNVNRFDNGSSFAIGKHIDSENLIFQTPTGDAGSSFVGCDIPLYVAAGSEFVAYRVSKLENVNTGEKSTVTLSVFSETDIYNEVQSRLTVNNLPVVVVPSSTQMNSCYSFSAWLGANHTKLAIKMQAFVVGEVVQGQSYEMNAFGREMLFYLGDNSGEDDSEIELRWTALRSGSTVEVTKKTGIFADTSTFKIYYDGQYSAWLVLDINNTSINDNNYWSSISVYGKYFDSPEVSFVDDEWISNMNLTLKQEGSISAPGGDASLPDQTGNAGKFLMTDGTTASWGGGSLSQISTAIGLNAQAYSFCVAVGNGAETGYTTGSTLVGAYAKNTAASSMTIAIGCRATAAAKNAIQLGSGSNYNTGYTNSDANTFKVGNANGNFEMMSADGTIPTDRYTTTPIDAGTYVPKLTIAEDGTATREWGPESGGAGGDYLPLSGGTMTGPLEIANFQDGTNPRIILVATKNGTRSLNGGIIYQMATGLQIYTKDSNDNLKADYRFEHTSFSADGTVALGSPYRKWTKLFSPKLNNGADLAVPTEGGTLARIEDINNIVEVLPTEENGYTTVKNFGNGYVEITGYAAIGTVGAGTGSEIQIDLPAGYTMANANYWVNIAPTSETTMFDLKAEAKARSTTHFMVAYKNEDAATGLTSAGVYWEIRGMLATA